MIINLLVRIGLAIIATTIGFSACSASVVAATALVLRDQVLLRSAPRDSGQVHAVLSAGDLLEVRSEKLDYLQVYDHERERAGFVRAAQVKRLSMTIGEAPELAIVVRFLQDSVGSESLGIAYAAAYVKLASSAMLNGAVGIEVLDALSEMADRLAVRASVGVPSNKLLEANLAAHLATSQRYGVVFKTFERDGRMQVCYDGDAARRVLGLAASNQQKARAALILSRPECIDTSSRLTDQLAQEKSNFALVDQIATIGIPDYVRNRLQLRKAAIASAIAFKLTRAAQTHDALTIGTVTMGTVTMGTAAINALATVSRNELSDSDQNAFTDAAVRVGASRWAAMPVGVPTLKGGLELLLREGQAGQTCVVLVQTKAQPKTELTKKCTYGTAWIASANSNPSATVVTLGVQPVEAWRELWVFRKTGDTWAIDVLPPSASQPNFNAGDIGYIEFAGFTPDALLVAKESRIQGRYKRNFEVLNLDGYTVKKQASDAGILSAFQKWQDVAWKKGTVSMR